MFNYPSDDTFVNMLGEDIDTLLEEESKRKSLKREEEVEDFKRLLQYKQNRKWLVRLLEQTLFMRDISGGSPDEILKNSARQSIGSWIVSEILQADPKMYSVMIKEMNENDD